MESDKIDEKKDCELVKSVDKIRGKYFITFDNGYKLAVNRDLYADNPLYEGEIVNISEYKHWLLVHQYRDALNKSISMLAVRERSSAEIKERLLSAGYLNETVDMVMYKLSKEKLLDDYTFAEHWSETRLAMKYGKLRISSELSRKGISAEDIRSIMDNIDKDKQVSDAERLAFAAFKRRKKEEPIDKTAHRITAMLARRGFDWDTTHTAVNKIIHDEDIDIIDCSEI